MSILEAEQLINAADALQKRMPPGWKVSDEWGRHLAGYSSKAPTWLYPFMTPCLTTKRWRARRIRRGRFAVLTVRGHNESTGDHGVLSFIGFTDDPANVPGKYNDKMLAKSITRKLYLEGDGSKTRVSEGFDIDIGDGSIHFAADYERPMPVWQYSLPAAPPGRRCARSRIQV